MSFVIFATATSAQAFAATVDAACGYPCPGNPSAPYPSGWTLRHADVIPHPDGTRWAYPLDGVPESVVVPPEAQVIDTLDATWTVE